MTTTSRHDELVPVTVIGGYLGAGKTTLINRLLAGDHGRRLAVLVNDFGSVAIDASLIESRDGDVISLRNGCLCCSLADELGTSLDRVLTAQPKPDQIVIEASGVAEPRKIAAYGQGWPGCRLDAVLVLVDAASIETLAADRFVGDLVTRQLRQADLLVATKGDVLTDEELAAVEDWLGTVGTPVVEAEHGEIAAELLLGSDAWPAPDSSRSGHEPGRPLQPRPPFRPEQVFASATISVPRPVDRARLETALDGWPDGVVRVKGIVAVRSDGEAFFVVQRVGRRWSIEPASASAVERIGGAGHLVLIGLRGIGLDLAACATDL